MADIDNFCCYCGNLFDDKKRLPSSEHIVPKSRGGSNLKHNLKRCCQKCNNWRSNMSYRAWRFEVQTLLNNNELKRGYNKMDLETIIENINFFESIVDSEGEDLLKKNDYKNLIIDQEYEELMQIQARCLREIMKEKGLRPEHLINAGIGKNQVYSVLRMSKTGKVDKPNYSFVTFLKVCRAIGIHLELQSLDTKSNIDLVNPNYKN